jgi:hypothetical protein
MSFEKYGALSSYKGGVVIAETGGAFISYDEFQVNGNTASGDGNQITRD